MRESKINRMILKQKDKDIADYIKREDSFFMGQSLLKSTP